MDGEQRAERSAGAAAHLLSKSESLEQSRLNVSLKDDSRDVKLVGSITGTGSGLGLAET